MLTMISLSGCSACFIYLLTFTPPTKYVLDLEIKCGQMSFKVTPILIAMKENPGLVTQLITT